MRVDQVIVGASAGDAITSFALAVRDVLRQRVASDVFAQHIGPEVAREIRPVAELDDRAAGPVVYHLSIGCTSIVEWLLQSSRPLVVCYHNITPARYFRRLDPTFAELLDLGRRELALLADRAQLAVADSAYNAQELTAVGYHDVRVVPPVTPAERLAQVKPHEPTARHLAEVVRGPLILYVGQLLPHKRIDRLLQAYHVLLSHHRHDAHLVAVGAARDRRYREALEGYARQLNLPRLWMTGPVSDAELVAFYRRADAFVTLSEHEGFCFPVVEAMAFGVPVVARGCAALPETVDRAGLLIAPSDDVAVAAEAVAEVLANTRLRNQLTGAGYRRASEFRTAPAIAAHVAALAEVV